jgi:hypothetical protein
LDSNRRTQHLIAEILELLQDLSYEALRQDKTITELQAKVAALEGKVTEQSKSALSTGRSTASDSPSLWGGNIQDEI